VPFVDRVLRLLGNLGIENADPALYLEPPRDLSYADRLLAGVPKPIVALVPGAEWETKRWGAEHFAELAAAWRARGVSVLLLGGPAERSLADAIVARVPDVNNAAGNTIEESLELLARSDLVIGGDTGLVHCARALHRPTVALFGPTDPRRHRFTVLEAPVQLGIDCQPCHDHGLRTCPLGHHRCMVDLPMSRVLDAGQALLDAV
jgi:heptosyltransferase-2